MAVLNLFKLNNDRWEYLGLGAALGLGLLAYLVMALGLLGWLYKSAIWVVMGSLIPPAVLGLRSFFKQGKPNLSTLDKWGRLGIVLLAWCTFFNIFMALAPAFLADSLKYHLTAPKWYISVHQIQFAPVFPFNMPQNLEMLYTAGMLIHSDTVGLLLHFFMGPLAALGIWALARQFLPLTTSIWAGVFFYVGTPYIPHAAQGVDLGPIFYSIWAFYAFIRWRKTKRLYWLCLAGLLAGLCAGTKYTGFYTPLSLSFLVVLALWKDRIKSGRGKMQIVLPLSLFCLFGCIAGCPWYVKNWIVTGNPIYPIFYPLLGGKGWNMTSYQEGIKRLGADMGLLGRSFIDFLLSPLRLFLLQNRIFVRGGTGLLTFSFAPGFLLLGKKYLKQYDWWLLFSVPFFTAWMIFSQYGRFLLPLLALWSIPCTAAAFHLLRKNRYLRTITIVILLAGTGMGAALAPLYASRFIPAVMGWESRDTFLVKTTWFYRDIQWMNKNLPQEARVMSEFVNVYYLDRPFIWLHARNAAWIDYGRVKTREDVLVQGLELGITHVFAVGQPDIQGWDRLVEEGLLARIYYNPLGRRIFSVAMGLSDGVPVAVYRVKTNDTAI